MPFEKQKTTPILADDPISVVFGERTRLNDIANAFRALNIGGSRRVGLQASGQIDLEDYLEFQLDGALLAGYTITARFEVKTEDAGTTVRPGFYDVTSAAMLFDGTDVSATTWTKQDIAITLPSATRWYRPVVTTNNAAAVVFAIAHLEIKAP